jgi:osmotically-inducible protein OsmY
MKALAFTLSVAAALALAACSSNESSKGSSSGATSGGATSEISQYTKESVLTTKVKTALAADVSLKTLIINVDSAGSVVTLKGTVDNADMKKKAEAVARGVEGVSSVHNELTVKSGG